MGDGWFQRLVKLQVKAHVCLSYLCAKGPRNNQLPNIKRLSWVGQRAAPA